MAFSQNDTNKFVNYKTLILSIYTETVFLVMSEIFDETENNTFSKTTFMSNFIKIDMFLC